MPTNLMFLIIVCSGRGSLSRGGCALGRPVGNLSNALEVRQGALALLWQSLLYLPHALEHEAGFGQRRRCLRQLRHRYADARPHWPRPVGLGVRGLFTSLASFSREWIAGRADEPA